MSTDRAAAESPLPTARSVQIAAEGLLDAKDFLRFLHLGLVVWSNFFFFWPAGGVIFEMCFWNCRESWGLKGRGGDGLQYFKNFDAVIVRLGLLI